MWQVFTLSSTILDSAEKTNRLSEMVASWRRKHPDPTVREKLYTHLVRRCVTRWNCEYDCLVQILALFVPVNDFCTSSSGRALKLDRFAFDEEEHTVRYSLTY